eukprot:TRINITY_DN521_c0_g1_i1.p1 TRINITY_DN521_c0_g1~~TRINITY_DN521_c0_g1_i1.p1  ORF type:complete len:118 (+),score=20.23 TRINITY_DN521_c0_g1_i1:279-632(+)
MGNKQSHDGAYGAETIEALEAIGATNDPMVPVKDFVEEQFAEDIRRRGTIGPGVWPISGGSTLHMGVTTDTMDSGEYLTMEQPSGETLAERVSFMEDSDTDGTMQLDQTHQQHMSLP